MLFQGIGCEKSEENMNLGVKMLSMAAEQNEPIALMALWQLCLMQGDSAQVTDICLSVALHLFLLTNGRPLNSSFAQYLPSTLKHFLFTGKCEIIFIASNLIFSRSSCSMFHILFSFGGCTYHCNMLLLILQAEAWTRSSLG